MDVNEAISQTLRRTAELRIPVWEADKPRIERISELEDYIALTGYYAGECMEERMRVLDELRGVEDEWAALVGWESFRGGSKTDQSAETARAKLRPDLAEQRTRLRWQAVRLDEQIKRMDRDYERCSRLYTMLSA